jgi:hypothetical protein
VCLRARLPGRRPGSDDRDVHRPHNDYPFGGYEFDPPNRYQQVYAAGAFGTSIFIDAIRFTSSMFSGLDVVGATGGEHDQPWGVPDPVFHHECARRWTLHRLRLEPGGQHGGLLLREHIGWMRISGLPFLYDPAFGNLLLDVTGFSQQSQPFGAMDTDGE